MNYHMCGSRESGVSPKEMLLLYFPQLALSHLHRLSSQRWRCFKINALYFEIPEGFFLPLTAWEQLRSVQAWIIST